jgi:mannose-6-phosphate isomerase-like protein (cupin superfamily)
VQDIEGLATQKRRVPQGAQHGKELPAHADGLEVAGREIGAEVHQLDQFSRVEGGSGEAVLDGVRTSIHAAFAVLVPTGARHSIVNTGSKRLKLYTLYTPSNHRDGIVHHTRTDAEADTEHLDGKLAE